MCDLAYAALVDQFEQDGRAVIAAGASEHPPQWYRAQVDVILGADAEPDAASDTPVAPEVLELQRALGVA